jgi:hypothetical protein
MIDISQASNQEQCEPYSDSLELYSTLCHETTLNSIEQTRFRRARVPGETHLGVRCSERVRATDPNLGVRLGEFIIVVYLYLSVSLNEHGPSILCEKA